MLRESVYQKCIHPLLDNFLSDIEEIDVTVIDEAKDIDEMEITDALMSEGYIKILDTGE